MDFQNDEISDLNDLFPPPSPASKHGNDADCPEPSEKRRRRCDSTATGVEATVDAFFNFFSDPKNAGGPLEKVSAYVVNCIKQKRLPSLTDLFEVVFRYTNGFPMDKTHDPLCQALVDIPAEDHGAAEGVLDTLILDAHAELKKAQQDKEFVDRLRECSIDDAKGYTDANIIREKKKLFQLAANLNAAVEAANKANNACKIAMEDAKDKVANMLGGMQ